MSHATAAVPSEKIQWWSHPRARKVIGVSAVIGVVSLLAWFFLFRPFVSTDDARVTATLVRLAPEGVSGKVIKLGVTEGDRVKAGQVLLELDHSVAEANLAKAKAKATQTERELKRVEQLASQNGIPPREVDNSRVAGQTAQADLQLAQIAYDRTFLKSPVDGVVVQKVAEVGNILEAGQSALTVADIDHAWISANIEETSVGWISVGQPVTIHVDEGGTLTGKVSEIRAATASQFALIQSENPSGNFTKLVQRIPIKVALDSHDAQALRAGQSVEVKIRGALMAAAAHTPASGEKDRNYPWKVLGVVMIGTLMGALDQSIVNVSLPSIMADFGSSLDEIEWIVTGYMLAFATLMPLTAWFRDRVGAKTLFIASMIVFTLGSLLCGMAWNLPTLVLARVIQALGGGAITPTGMAMISEEFPPHERAKALGYWGMGVIVGPAFGPTLGGWLTELFGWRSIFLINLPIGIVGIALASAILKHDRPHAPSRQPFDFWGFAFLSLFLVSFLLGLSKGEHEGWSSAYIITCGILSTIGFTGFLLVESILPYRIVDIGLFKIPVFSACLFVTVVRSTALFGGVFLLPLYLQQLRGLSVTDSGVLLLWGSLTMGVMMPITPKLMDRFGPKIVSIVGLLGVALFMFELRDINVNTSISEIIVATLIRGVGIGLMFIPVTAVALNSVPKRSTGMASSMLNLIQQVGGSVGIAMLATVFSHRVKFHLGVFGSEVSTASPAFREAFRRVSEHAHQLGYTHAESARIAFMSIGKTVAVSAQSAGFGDSFLFGTFVVLIGVAAAFLLPHKVVKLSQEEQLAAME